jgi:hypothetical protein
VADLPIPWDDHDDLLDGYDPLPGLIARGVVADPDDADE